MTQEQKKQFIQLHPTRLIGLDKTIRKAAQKQYDGQGPNQKQQADKEDKNPANQTGEKEHLILDATDMQSIREQFMPFMPYMKTPDHVREGFYESQDFQIQENNKFENVASHIVPQPTDYLQQQPFPEAPRPIGMRQTGPLQAIRHMPEKHLQLAHTLQLVQQTQPALPEKRQPAWRAALNSPTAKIVLGLGTGVALLFLVAHFVNLPATFQILRQNLTTPKGILLALLSGVAFLLAFSIRGLRWKLFLNPIGQVSTAKAIQLFLVGIFLNFLLPIRGGEVAKSLMLKRIANIPVSRSLPTVAIDKALDLMPALFIMAVVPFLGITMDIKLWLVLGAVGSLLIGLIFFVALAALKRTAAISLLQRITRILPMGHKIESFATSFVDSLLLGASQPRIFIPAVLLTCIAVIFDGLFAMLAFWTIGFPLSFGTAIFGYTVYNMFYILPTPPGQVGSNEAIGLLIFSGLLHLPADKVTAMFVFSHPWAALLMCITGMAGLSALGLTLSSAMKVQSGK
ncbi:MAG TPA: lysylphosphatidylglycerol synthase transmembrane domain-containing protein [Ktedonobacteraceae bacterium]|nr:lysylphosphatidylglycerol synthase transmembrane domain-containing protein [Ktedonobacteraceae bacterium]